MVAFEQLYYRYEQPLKYFAFRMTRSEYVAEEIIQEVFIKLWSVRESIPQEVSFNAYLYRTVRNKALNYLRDAARRDALYEVYKQDVPDDGETTAYMVAWAELEKQLNDLINKLPPQKKKIYLLYQDGKSCEEIGKLFNISERTVQNHLYKSQSRIRLQLYLSSLVTLLWLMLIFL